MISANPTATRRLAFSEKLRWRHLTEEQIWPVGLGLSSAACSTGTPLVLPAPSCTARPCFVSPRERRRQWPRAVSTDSWNSPLLSPTFHTVSWRQRHRSRPVQPHHCLPRRSYPCGVRILVRGMPRLKGLRPCQLRAPPALRLGPCRGRPAALQLLGALC